MTQNRYQISVSINNPFVACMPPQLDIAKKNQMGYGQVITGEE